MPVANNGSAAGSGVVTCAMVATAGSLFAGVFQQNVIPHAQDGARQNCVFI
jgi:hypothetical protein